MSRAGKFLLCVLCCASLTGCGTETATSTDRPQQQLYSEIPFSKSEEKDIRRQIEQNWNLGDLAGSPSVKDMVVKLRIKLLPDGTVTGTELLNSQPGNPDFPKVAESAIRAVMISSPLKLAPGKTYESMVLVFHPDEVVE